LLDTDKGLWALVPFVRSGDTALRKGNLMAKKKSEFSPNDFVVYPAHGVGKIVSIETQEIAGFELEMFVIAFEKDKMTLRVPTNKAEEVGMRSLSAPDVVSV